MPLYSFDLPLAIDQQVQELPDDHAAWSEAVTALGNLLRDIDGGLPRATDWKVKVTEGEREVAHIHLVACLQGHRGHNGRAGDG